MSITKADALGRVEGEIVALLRRARRQAGVNAAFVHPDLSAGALAILQHVVASDHDVHAAEVCEHLGADKGWVSRKVQGMVESGLVERRRDPADGRAWVIGATPEAIKRLGVLIERRRSRFQGRLADWTAQDLTELADVLHRYNAALAER